MRSIGKLEEGVLPRNAAKDGLPPLQSIIRQLNDLLRSDRYHYSLRLLIDCQQLLTSNSINTRCLSFDQDIKPILEAAKTLNEIANEKYFHAFLSRSVIEPLKGWIIKNTDKNCQQPAVDFIVIHLSNGDDGGVMNNTALPAHEATSFKELLHEDGKQSNKKLNRLREDYIKLTQKSLKNNKLTLNKTEVLVYTLLHYWRLLKQCTFRAYKENKIQPLMELGEMILMQSNGANQSPDFHQKSDRLLLLLYALLHDHHQLKAEEFTLWPEKGFVRSLCTTKDPDVAWIPRKFNISIIDDYPSQLHLTRAPFQGNLALQSICQAQRGHSRLVIDLLGTMVKAACAVMGKPPCQLEVYVLGSTSRLDRRPYSDIELMILHSEPPQGMSSAEKEHWQNSVEIYLYHVMTLVELMIVRCGETPESHEVNGGFRLDDSSHPLKRRLWGTPADMAKRFVVEVASDEAVIKNCQHAWLYPELFAMLNPLGVYPREAGSLLAKYHHHLSEYLDKQVNTNLQEADNKGSNNDNNFDPDPDKIRTLCRVLDINRSCFRGLTRRQGIAVTVLWDVLSNRRKALNPNQSLNIKNAYYKPLAYLALCLKHFYKLQYNNPDEIFKAMQEQYVWGGEAITLLLQTALQFIGKKQIELHTEKQHQEEEMPYRRPTDQGLSDSEKAFWAGADLIETGILEPLENAMNTWIQSPETSFLNLLQHVLRCYMQVREPWVQRWEQQTSSKDLLSHAMLMPLASYPSENGWSPAFKSVMRRHIEQLRRLTSGNKTPCIIEGIPGAPESRYLTASLAAECFNDQGEFLADPQYSSERSKVRKINLDDGCSFFIKVKPGNKEILMGREFAVQQLHLLMSGEAHIALGWPLQLWHQKALTPIHAWISAAIEGHKLSDEIDQSHDGLESFSFDSDNFSELFKLTFVTCPEDMQPGNVIIQPINQSDLALVGANDNKRQEKTHLTLIDFGHCFVADKREDIKFRGLKKTTYLQMKSILYCHKNEMNLPLSEASITRLRLLNIEKTHQFWLRQLDDLNKLYQSILAISDDAHQPQSLFYIDATIKACVKTRLSLLQEAVILTRRQSITGNTVLMRLEPQVGLAYQSRQGTIKSCQDFYDIDPTAYIKDPKSGKIYSSVTFSQLQERTLTPEQLQRSLNLTPNYFRSIDFKGMQINGEPNLEIQEYTLRLINACAKNSTLPFRYLDLSGCAVITEDELITLLKALPELEVLNIQQCRKLNDNTVFKLFSHRYHFHGFLNQEFDTLCPKLQRLYFSVKNQLKDLQFNVSIETRNTIALNYNNIYGEAIAKIKKQVSQIKNDLTEVFFVRLLLELNEISLTDAVEIYRHGLKSNSSDIRRSAIYGLGKVKPITPEALETLLNALNDEDWGVRYTATLAFSDMNPAPQVAALQLANSLDAGIMPFTKSFQADKARTAHELKINTIASATTTRAEQHAHVQLAAAKALAKIKPVSLIAIKCLLQATRTEMKFILPTELQNSTLRNSAEEALRSIEPSADESIPSIIEQAHHLKMIYWSSAQKYIHNKNPAIEITRLCLTDILLLLDAQQYYLGQIRDLIITALEQLGPVPPEFLPGLLEALNHRDINVSELAAGLIGQMRPVPQETLDTLVTTLKDTSVTVKNNISKAYGDMMPPLPNEQELRLLELPSTTDEPMQAPVTLVLSKVKITPARTLSPNHKTQQDVDALRTEPRDKKYSVLVNALNELKLLELNGAFAHEDEMSFLAQHLGNLKPVPLELTNLLLSYLHNEGHLEKVAAAWLKPLPEKVINILLSDLKIPDNILISAATWALSKLPSIPKEAIPTLLDLLNKDDLHDRESAASALSKIADMSLIPLFSLIKLLSQQYNNDAIKLLEIFFSVDYRLEKINIILSMPKPMEAETLVTQSTAKENILKIIFSFAIKEEELSRSIPLVCKHWHQTFSLFRLERKSLYKSTTIPEKGLKSETEIQIISTIE